MGAKKTISSKEIGLYYPKTTPKHSKTRNHHMEFAQANWWLDEPKPTQLEEANTSEKAKSQRTAKSRPGLVWIPAYPGCVVPMMKTWPSRHAMVAWPGYWVRLACGWLAWTTARIRFCTEVLGGV